MNRNRPEKKGFGLVGLISVLVVLSSLSLCIFAFLNAVSVSASSKISRASTEAFMAYYEADTRAEELLARLRAGECPQEVSWEEDGTAAFVLPISDQTELFVRIRLSGSDYSILNWQPRESGSWLADTYLPVWTGD